jgi:hypothetical protein
MRMSCGECSLRNVACAECVVGSLVEPPAGAADLGVGKLAALEVLAAAGLVPRLRWAPPVAGSNVMKVTQPSHNPFRSRPKASAITR